MASVDAITMDHLAVASDRAWDNLIRYAYHLGGRYLGGPENDPEFDPTDRFYFCQVEFAGGTDTSPGTKFELLEPLPGSSGSEFLRRFLWRNGPGPHHYTFKVPDIHDAIGAVRGAGYDVVGENIDDPAWQEAFLHPKQSHGIVIQLACQGDENEGWIDATPLPPSGRSALPTLRRCVHLVADLDSATKLFATALGMQLTAEGGGASGPWTELTSGPWTLRLVQPEHEPLQHWLGDRTGRVHHVEFELDDPAVVPGARPLGATPDGPGAYELAPEHNLGLRLLLHPRTQHSPENQHSTGKQ